MYRRRYEVEGARVSIAIEGRTVEVPAGETVAAALLVSSLDHTRTTAVGGARRAPYCLMGVCFECLVEIDGAPNRQACMITVRDGMRIRRQLGAREP